MFFLKKKDLFSKCRAFKRADRVKAIGLYSYFRPLSASWGRRVESAGSSQIMIGSNNYLGLTHHPRVKQAAKHAIDLYGTGCTGSRLLNGNLDLHEKLEKKLASFLKKEDALVFNSGFLANQGSISSLIGPKDVVFSDEENHASIIEGTRLIAGKVICIKHNDPEDFKRKLKKHRHQFEGALLVSDGVFSMSGDIFKLNAFLPIAKKYHCRIYIDEAHALGVLGPQGQGTAFHFGLEKEVDLLMGTFSKSFASLGGFVAGDRKVINYLRHYSRPFIFSAAMPPASVATVLECLSILEEEPHHLEKLWRNVKKMKKALDKMGFITLGSQTPILPLLIGADADAFVFAEKLFQKGIFATPVVSPGVPKGCALVRTSYMASHTEEDLNRILEVLSEVGNELGILNNPKKQSKLSKLVEKHFRKKSAISFDLNQSKFFLWKRELESQFSFLKSIPTIRLWKWLRLFGKAKLKDIVKQQGFSTEEDAKLLRERIDQLEKTLLKSKNTKTIQTPLQEKRAQIKTVSEDQISLL